MRQYEDFIRYQTDDLVWQRLSTQTYRLDVAESNGQPTTTFYLKKYVYRRRRWRFLLRRDKPAVEYRNYEFLRRWVGPCVPDVVATGRRRKWLMLHDAFILTLGLPNTAQLDEYARRHWKDNISRDERIRQEALIRNTADLVRRMHAVHFFHIDLQWRNILIRTGTVPSNPEVFLIDAPRGGPRYLRLRREHGRLRDLSNLDKLARAYLSRTQRLRWYVGYAGHRRLNREDRRLITAVLADRTRYERAKMRLLSLDE